jgi:transcriptional regulator with XRE-family HTH domain
MHGGQAGVTMRQHGPTVARRRVGARLRRLREARTITGAAAGHAIRSSTSKISRMEAGQVPFKERDLTDLLTLYRASAAERTEILSLVTQANEPGWWERYNDVLPGWAKPYIGLESEADLIRSYGAQLIPALLQTEDYARACPPVGGAVSGASTNRTAGRLASMRVTRQERLAAPDGPRLWVVLDESALLHPAGGADVMRAQLGHLIEMAKLPNVTLQVLPLRAAGRIPGGPFTILRFDDPDLPDVVYLEHLAGASHLDRRPDVEPYLAAIERLSFSSEPPTSTIGILSRILGRWRDGAEDARP